jgi:hypothetical protein
VKIRTGRDGGRAQAHEVAELVSRALHAAADQVEPQADGLERIRAKIRLAGATRPGFLAGLARMWATIRDRWDEPAARTARLDGRTGNKRRVHRYGKAGGTVDLHEVQLRPAIAIACAVFAVGVTLAFPRLRQGFLQLSSAASSALFSSKNGPVTTAGDGKPTDSSKPQFSEPSERSAAWSAAGGVFVLLGVGAAIPLWLLAKNSGWELALSILSTAAIGFGLYWMLAALIPLWPFSLAIKASETRYRIDQRRYLHATYGPNCSS